MVKQNFRTVSSNKILRGYVHSFSNWSDFLPIIKFAINKSVHASTTHTPFYVNGLNHPRIPALIHSDSGLRGEGLTRAKTAMAIAHHVSPQMTLRLMPITIMSTSRKSTLAVARTLLLHQTLMIIPARKGTPPLKKRRTD